MLCFSLFLSLSFSFYLYLYLCVCVCVCVRVSSLCMCVCVWETDGKRENEVGNSSPGSPVYLWEPPGALEEPIRGERHIWWVPLPQETREELGPQWNSDALYVFILLHLPPFFL